VAHAPKTSTHKNHPKNIVLLLFVKGKKAEPVIPYRLQKLTVSMYNISLLTM